MSSSIRSITEFDVADFAFGCALLGTGGGGSVGGATLEVAHAIREFGPVPVVELHELPRDGLVMPLSGVGAPTVSFEMLSNGGEASAVRAAVEKEFGAEVVAVMASEIGGANGVETAKWASTLGLPLLDADAMGRAFPEVQMVSFYVADAEVTPLTMADFQGNVSTIRPVSGEWSESLARAFSVACGGMALMSDYTMTAGEMAGKIVLGSISRAVAIGRAARLSADPVDAIQQELGAFHLISGKVTDLERRTGGGFVRGSFIIDGSASDKGRGVRIEIQNENLVAIEDGRVLAMVPDLITLVDTQTGIAIATEELMHGMRVSVLAWPCDEIWRTERGIQTTGPRAFGYDLDYTPIEELHGA
jgi:DUF917 family protein